MSSEDISEVAKLGEQCFNGLKPYRKSFQWISSNFCSNPRAIYYVAIDVRPIGYILWLEKGGFREKAVMELEQICVNPQYRSKGIGKRLIIESLRDVMNSLLRRGSKLKLVEITTGTENEAQKLYTETIGAQRVATIPDLFNGDELIMIARYRDIMKKLANFKREV